jgi:AraC family L-rhamnose operon transcriptional activator RhaR
VTRLLWTEPLAPGVRGVLHRRLAEEQIRNIEGQLRILSRSPDEPFTVRAGRLLVLLGQLGKDIYPGELRGQGGVHVAVRQGMQLLEDACDEEWDLARLAAATRLNPSYLARLFKAATGRSPMEYLARHRAERAANLLLATDQPVGEIGVRVGWSDPNYFSRRFKSVFGVTPTAYRTQQASRSVPTD